jgi:hypothetical protein
MYGATMSHFKLIDKLNIKIEETKETVHLDDGTDTITRWWVNAHDVELKLREVFEQGSGAIKGRKYVNKLEEENRKLKSQLVRIKRALKGGADE